MTTSAATSTAVFDILSKLSFSFEENPCLGETILFSDDRQHVIDERNGANLGFDVVVAVDQDPKDQSLFLTTAEEAELDPKANSDSNDGFSTIPSETKLTKSLKGLQDLPMASWEAHINISDSNTDTVDVCNEFWLKPTVLIPMLNERDHATCTVDNILNDEIDKAELQCSTIETRKQKAKDFSLIPSSSAQFQKRLKLLKSIPKESKQECRIDCTSIETESIHGLPSDVSEYESQPLHWNEVAHCADELSNDGQPNEPQLLDRTVPIPQLPATILLEKIAPFVGTRTTWNSIATLNLETHQLSKQLDRRLYRPWPNVRRRVPTGRPWTIALANDYLCCGTDQGGLLLWEVHGNGSPVTLQGKTISTHNSRINSVQCFGDWVISGGDDKMVRIWNVETGRCETVLGELNASITYVSILKKAEPCAVNIKPKTPSQQHILVAAACQDSQIQCFVVVVLLDRQRVASSKLIWSVEGAHRGPVHCIALYERDGNCFLVSGGSDERLLRWNLGGAVAASPVTDFVQTSGKIASATPDAATCLFTYEGEIRSIVIAHHGSNDFRIAASFGRNVFVFWHSNSNESIHAVSSTNNSTLDWRIFKGHSNNIRSIDFSPCGKMIATAGSDGSIRLWDVSRGTWIRKWMAPHNGFLVCSLTFTWDGKSLISAGSDGTIVIEAI